MAATDKKDAQRMDVRLTVLFLALDYGADLFSLACTTVTILSERDGANNGERPIFP